MGLNFVKIVLFITFISICNSLRENIYKSLGSTFDEGRYFVGQLKGKGKHQISGEVYIVDDRTFLIKNITIPFYKSKRKISFGLGKKKEIQERVNIPNIMEYNEKNETCRKDRCRILHDIIGANIILKTFKNVFTFSFKKLFLYDMKNASRIFAKADLMINKSIIPKALKLDQFSDAAFSGNCTILDSRTLYIPHFTYRTVDDNGVPKPHIYLVLSQGLSSNYTSQFIVMLAETGRIDQLRAYEGEDVEFRIPYGYEFYDFHDFGIFNWTDYTYLEKIILPKHDEYFVPADFGQTTITPPWWYERIKNGLLEPYPRTDTRFSNCREIIPGKFQLQWEIDRLRRDTIWFSITAVMRLDQYALFGISGNGLRSELRSSDNVIVWYDDVVKKTRTTDSYTTDINTCTVSKNGICADVDINLKDNINVYYTTREGGMTTSIYSRPIRGTDKLDRDINVNRTTQIVALIGTVDENTVPIYFHPNDLTIGNYSINFFSKGDYTCKPFGSNSIKPNEIVFKKVALSKVENFTVAIGPRLNAISIAQWNEDQILSEDDLVIYINGVPTPNLYVNINVTYSFITHTGLESSKFYAPFYITNNKNGGYGLKTEKERKKEIIYAGVDFDKWNNPIPVGVGKICEYEFYKNKYSNSRATKLEDFIKLKDKNCVNETGGILSWKVPLKMPNVVYYQSYMHKNVGGKIMIAKKSDENDGNGMSSIKISSLLLISLQFLILIFR